ncbi:MAG TPA: valine--tRNA ligase [Sphingomicrobium sp.]|nr:valine--tRNA ligase [Sphingomicrobium sp.]
MTELAKTFEPGPIEARWYAHWEGQGLFRPERGDAEPFTIVMPPPNVTGSLHIGHALDNTLQDILTRHARMQGKDALWVVGMDHAGIATQMVVERELEKSQDKRTNYSREGFVAKVWEWKEESGGQITRQLRRLGASCDWSNERFTMDEGFSAAVIKVFVELHKRGLAYRDKRLVNWDPRFQTAISDLEVETREVQGKFWHLKYPLADGSGAIHVATTRPETMLADMAVAVHPEDERYTALVGKQVKLPITGRLIPVITDEHADPELGSGAVKITPGHDFNDFEVGRRAGFKPGEMLNMLDEQARITQTQDGLIPAELIGLDRFEARKRVVELLEAEGALEKVEDRTIATPYGDRSGVVIEPWLTDQWYVNVAPLAERVMAATRAGEIRIVPETWSKTWFNWLENIQPWCVSRQLWWGHRIPAWFDQAGNVFVTETLAEAQQLAGEGIELRQEEDVLDTWFSSALWPFATLGWPNETEDLKRHYPNDVLISGFDILFFWDARMAMQGLEFMDEAPWRTLYLHGLVRDAQGQKMSKSKGNTVDPLGLIDKYGADALRFTLAAMESQGRDIKLDEKRVEGYRNFATKLWNAARFLQGNGVGASQGIAAPEASLPVNRWIIGEVVETLAKLDKAFAELRFDEMADAIYHFTWGTFCDWYVELIKGAFDDETRAVSAWAFDQILVMLHPFMPFVTEELWHSMASPAHPRPYGLIVAKWPEPKAQRNAQAAAEIEWLIGLIQNVRATKAALGAADKTVVCFISKADPDRFATIDRYLLTLKRMCRLDQISVRTPHGVQQLGGTIGDVEIDAETIIAVEGEGKVQVPYEGVIGTLDFFDVVDLDAERARLSKAVAAAEKDRDSLAARLANPAFAERAKPEAVEKARADHDARAAEAERLSAALARLG